MQTDKQDRHHLPILPSNTETAIHATPPPFFFVSFTMSAAAFSPLLFVCLFLLLLVHMHVYEVPNPFFSIFPQSPPH